MLPKDRAARYGRKLTSTLERARIMDDGVRFAVLELAAPVGRTHAHRLTGSPFEVTLRHRSQDAGTVHEVFVDRVYEPPAPIAALPAPALIMDMGSNIGCFALDALARWPFARVIGFEPAADNRAVAQATINRNQLADRYRLRPEAVSNRSGWATLTMSSHAENVVTANGDGERVRLVDLFEVADGADMVKLDVEGSEWDILDDSRLAELDARVVVMEHHPVDGRRSTREHALDRLRAAGYACEVTVTDGRYGTLWAWRP